MAAPASPVIRLDAAAVDPVTVAYLRDLVERLEGKCYHLACDVQIAAAAADADLFRLRPEPSSTPWRSSSARGARRWRRTGGT
uniref:Uncharacterized protein n=1 Tax=Oryza nivara TaxID=4536 RepID=A0A0E0JAU8_ORYNI